MKKYCSCGEPNSPTAKFCAECGEPMGAKKIRAKIEINNEDEHSEAPAVERLSVSVSGGRKKVKIEEVFGSAVGESNDFRRPAFFRGNPKDFVKKFQEENKFRQIDFDEDK